MDTLLGLLGVAVFVVAMLAISAAVTYSVVKLTSRKKDEPQPSE